MWRKLKPEEANEFRAWAYESFKPGDEINTTWHPVVQEACHKIQAQYWKEQATFYLEEEVSA